MLRNTNSTATSQTEGMLDLCYRKGLSFFCIRKPDGSIRFGATDRALSGFHYGSFVIAPFENSRNIFSIHPSMTFKEIRDYQPEIESVESLYPFPPESTSPHDHARGVLRISNSMRSGEKAVLSKVIVRRLGLDITGLFEKLCLRYPDATVFCFYTPVSSLYIGATPELLLSSLRGTLKSFSLAGTRPVGSGCAWDRKNVEEQRIVTDFIADIFRKNRLFPSISDPFTHGAGDIEHICSLIEADISVSPFGLDNLRSLLADLSPTPALCGFPKEKALGLIRECERHSRGYYGGYFGFFSSPTDFDLYVNLRSLRYENGQIALFAGGGITHLSDPQSEWTETEAKASTLLSVIEDDSII